MKTDGPQRLWALALQLAALAVLSLALLGTSWLDARTKPRLVVLVDRSQSVPRPASEAAVAEVATAVRAAGAELQLLPFAGTASLTSTPDGDVVAGLQPSTTNIERALEVALAAHAEDAYAGAVVISDGFENAGDATRALRAAREAQLPVQWLAAGRSPPRTYIADVLAPQRASVGQPIRLSVQLAGQLDTPLRVTVTARSAAGDTQRASGMPDRTGRVALELATEGTGAMLVDVSLEDASSGRRLDARHDAAVIDVAARAPVLYVQGATGSLAQSLGDGGWALDVVPATRADAHAWRLDGYEAIVLDDVAVSDASARFWSALVVAVQQRGVGLLVLGGERSFGRGGYRGSALETILPVTSEPPALEEPASVVFVVDKSGSMGEGSGGVDRFRLAQRAVLETARGFGDRDRLGLVVFDVEPEVLVPLGPAHAATQVFERPWRASPRGGTRLAPALEVAIAELERADIGRRMLVVVTDGFATDAPIANLGARLARSRIETIALAVGPDADVASLQRLVGGDGDSVLSVNEVAALPQVMRSGVERRRSRIERGSIPVEQRLPLPFVAGRLEGWPPVAAYAVTRSRPQATVAVQAGRGDPLLAYQASGQGRVMAVTSGLGPWTPRWMPWREWPRLAGGLLQWVGGTPIDGTVALAVSDLATGMLVEAEVRSGLSPEGSAAALTMRTPTSASSSVDVDPVAPGRLRAVVRDDGPGLYTFVLSAPSGTERRLHLRRQQGEDEVWGTNPALDAWRSAGLVTHWRPESVPRRPTTDTGRSDRWLVGLSLALFCAGVLIDRSGALRRMLRPR